MMARALLVLNNDWNRLKATRWIEKAPLGTRVEFREQKRSTEQNDKMWACLSDIAQQQTWHGVKLSPDDWKLIFMDALNNEMRIVPNLDGTGFVNLGRSSSRLSKTEMSDLIELIHMWGAQHNINFNPGASDLTAPATAGVASKHTAPATAGGGNPVKQPSPASYGGVR